MVATYFSSLMTVLQPGNLLLLVGIYSLFSPLVKFLWNKRKAAKNASKAG